MSGFENPPPLSWPRTAPGGREAASGAGWGPPSATAQLEFFEASAYSVEDEEVVARWAPLRIQTVWANPAFL